MAESAAARGVAVGAPRARAAAARGAAARAAAGAAAKVPRREGRAGVRVGVVRVVVMVVPALRGR